MKPFCRYYLSLALLVSTAFAHSPAPTPPAPNEVAAMSAGSEFTFLAEMIPHHEGAVQSAELALQTSKRPEVRDLAQQIIDAQNAEIEQMQGWLERWYPGRDPRQAAAQMVHEMEEMSTQDLARLSGDAFDRAFLSEMVMHHQLAVAMATSLLEHGGAEHKPVRTLAENVIRTQNAEIKQMQGWLNAWFGRTAPSSPHSGH